MQTRIGTSQQQRELQTLLMDTFQVDYRSTEELLLYILAYYSKINYYNDQNELDGYWDEVFSESSIFYMLDIIYFDLEMLREQSLNQEDTIANIRLCHEKIMTWRDKLKLLGEWDLSEKLNSILNDDLYNIQVNILDPRNRILEINTDKTVDKKSAKLFSETSASSTSTNTENVEGLRSIYTKLLSYISQITQNHLQELIALKSDLRPDVSMLLAFLQLYKYAQNNINKISKRHLDFYYSEVLKTQLAAGVQTSTFVNFQLVPNKTMSYIDKATTVTAGKLFGSATDVLFQTQKAIVVLNTELTSVQTLFISKNQYIDVGTNSPLVSNINLTNLQINSGNITDQNGAVASMFGASTEQVLNPQIIPDEVAQMGFFVGSPVLFLSEGKREISFVINFDAEMAATQLWLLLDEIQQRTKSNFDVVFEEVFEPAFNLSYTTALGWQTLSEYRVLYDRAANSISLLIELGPTDPAIDVFADENQLTWPSFRVDLNPYAPTYIYSFLAGLKMNNIQIEVSVTGMRDLSMYSSAGKIIPNKAFDLFGSIPQCFNYVMFGKAELFKKQITELDFNVQWSSIPADFGGFDAYYRGYSHSFTNESFLVQPSILSAGNWQPTDSQLAPAQVLFDTVTVTTPQGQPSIQLAWTKKLSISNYADLGASLDYSLKDPIIYSPQTQSGFVKFTLVQPIQAFGAKEYVKDYTEVARYNATNNPKLPYPNSPFVPNVSACSLDYKASDELSFNLELAGNKYANVNVGEFKQITPFGLKDILKDKSISTDPAIIASYEQQAYLILSLSPIEFPSTISALFYLKSTGNPPVEGLPPLVWEYQNKQNWEIISKENLLSNGTQNFVKSGIIEVNLPKVDLAEGETYRIRVSPKGNPEVFPNLAGIYLNAVETSCISTDNNVIGQVVPAQSITALSAINPEIQGVFQPMDSQQGKVAETEYYKRIRERLRHKQRSISIWDYEHMILEEFPEVGIVKCTNLDASFQSKPNNIRLVVMSKDWTFENQKYLNLEELADITKFVQNLSNPFLKVITMNPISEMLLVNCLITFDPEDVGGYYLNQLNQEIINYLSPVSLANGGLMGIGKTVVPQMLSGFLERLPYVRSVNKLYIEQIVFRGDDKYQIGVFANGDTITCTTDWSILMPVSQHNIFTKSNAADFKTKVGISSMELGTDFILGPESDDLPDAEKTLRPSIETDTKINAVLFINENYLNDDQNI